MLRYSGEMPCFFSIDYSQVSIFAKLTIVERGKGIAQRTECPLRAPSCFARCFSRVLLRWKKTERLWTVQVGGVNHWSFHKTRHWWNIAFAKLVISESRFVKRSCNWWNSDFPETCYSRNNNFLNHMIGETVNFLKRDKKFASHKSTFRNLLFPLTCFIVD